MRDQVLEEVIAKAAGYGGIEGRVSLDPAQTGRRPALVRMQVEPELARSWRVTLGAPQFENVASAAPTLGGGGGGLLPTGFPTRWPEVNQTAAGVIAHVTWGHGGAAFEAWIDWRVGSSFVVHGSDVQLELLVSPGANAPGAPTATTTAGKFSAAITPDDSPSPHSNPPSLTFWLGAVGDASEAEVPIPPFARAVRVVRSPAAQDQFQLEARLTAGGAAVGSIVFDGANVGFAEQWGLPAQARWLALTNTSGLDTYDFGVEFLLDLG
jgi:hypothetical protein